MNKKTGIVIKQTFIRKEKMAISPNKVIDVNLYHLEITGESRPLLYKRDKNHIQDIVGKKIKYQVTKDNLIYNSKTSDSIQKPKFTKLELDAIELYKKQGYSKEKSIQLLYRNKKLQQ